MKYKGKIKSVPATLEQVRKAGVFLLNTGVYQNADLNITLNECDVSYLEKNIHKVRTLIVEFDDFDQSGMRVFAKHSIIPLKQIPLAWSQYQDAVDRGVIDMEKEIEFVKEGRGEREAILIAPSEEFADDYLFNHEILLSKSKAKQQ